MVKGLEKFRDKFKNFNDQYVIIGGTACDMAMEKAGLKFRATKDLDVVLQIEVLNKSFVRNFWQYINEGQYIIQQNSTGKNNYYRFVQPQQPDYPFMIELFSRKPDNLTLEENAHLTPILTNEDLSSLSAILLDDDYYTFLHAGKQIIYDISVLRPEHIIPLKAKAWIDLTERRKKGDSIDSKAIRKHKNDVFRVYQIILVSRQLLMKVMDRVVYNSHRIELQGDSVRMKMYGID